MPIKNSKIQWTGPTFNPWQGCVKKTIRIASQTVLREECRNCYMYRDKKRYGQKPQIVVRSKPPTFNKPLKWQKEAELGLRSGTDRLVFTCSWSDFFNPEADGWRSEAWEIIRQCPDLIFQILTKLPERIGDHLPVFWDEIKSHIWLGYSCGMPGTEGGIEHLIKHDSAIRFLSCEPLLGRIDVERFLYRHQSAHRVDWVIVGGESGPEARSMNIVWLDLLMRQCRMAKVPFFVKQMGSAQAKANGARDTHGGNMDDWSEEYKIREFPKERV